MSRIRKAYETQFRWLLQRARARRLDQGVQWLVAKAGLISGSEGIPLSDALTRVYNVLAAKYAFEKPNRSPATIQFFCDAGLGGLARWLRAAGYEARWEAGIADDVLLREAGKAAAAILTTDSMLMERRLLRDRVIPSLWLPPTLTIAEQLALVFREFSLQVRGPRCMACGGELRRADKESLRERIPPRTYRWLDEYFVCALCGKLFWHGTHWHKIHGRLSALARAAGDLGPDGVSDSLPRQSGTAR
jgi:uncharacterized protein with PIN domain